ncbi:response regulator [candidate division WOR-3 bacterium]|nr:response regulator [candidate division WOR-3 bacterium]
MSKVLIVDDEALFLKSLSDGLKISKKMKGAEIITAENGRVAIGILEKNQDIDLVITDLRMPEVDGFKLIAHMSRKFSAIPIIVMTAFGTSDIEKKVKSSGILHYIEKPIDFEQLLKIITSELSVRKRGTLKGINLSTFLQIVGMEKMTCALAVSSGDKRGGLSLRAGEIIDANTKYKKGLEAALDVVTWENVTIDIGDLGEGVEDKVSMTLENLLLEAFKRKDEVADMVNAFENLDLEKEDNMDVQGLNKAVEVLKKDVGDGLLATDIFTAEDGQSVAGFNTQPAASAMFNQMTNYLKKALQESKFPPLGKYYLIDLVDDKMVVVIPMGDFMWGMLLDSKKAPMGLLLNVIMPKALSGFEEALIG